MTETEERVSPIPAPARRDTGWFLVVLGITALLYLLSVPWAFAMIATGPLGAFLAARALYRSRRATGIVGYRVAMSAGVVVSLFSVAMGMTFAVFAEVITDFQDCRQRAVTQQAQRTCEAEYQESVRDTIEDLLEQVGLTSAP
ncbi:hypothetical protein [uncultured Demequina sp.]|uniref:hypothetical protein n=1 Tax=uncultured Demequina sp. TaxID=693499 RepID=UPI0025EA0350|nr:hypothetical protein [uncultured Demequina sp.]